MQSLTAKINKTIEQQMVSAASAGKLTIMKNTADVYVGETSCSTHIIYSFAVNPLRQVVEKALNRSLRNP
jgi:hypothetical protein